ncbi:zinc finger protein 655 isoform X1 [Sigmodon hispidus]
MEEISHEATGSPRVQFQSLESQSECLSPELQFLQDMEMEQGFDGGFPISKPDGISQREQELQVFDLETKNSEVIRDDCSDGETREENKLLVPKRKISEEVHSYKVRVGKFKQNIAQVPETREVYKSEDRLERLQEILRKFLFLEREFRQITISKKNFNSEKNSEPEKSFNLDSTLDTDQRVLRIQTVDDTLEYVEHGTFFNYFHNLVTVGKFVVE